MENIGHHYIGGLYHPAISMRNRKTARYVFQRWIHGTVIARNIPASVQICQYKNQLDLRILFLLDRKSTRLNSSHVSISYAVFCLKKKIKILIYLHLTTKNYVS